MVGAMASPQQVVAPVVVIRLFTLFYALKRLVLVLKKRESHGFATASRCARGCYPLIHPVLCP